MRSYLTRTSPLDGTAWAQVPPWHPRNSSDTPRTAVLLDQIAYEAKGRVMEGQPDRDVLVWVLNQISTTEVIL